MNKEDAKAIQEVSKTTSRALDSVDGLGRFVEDAFGYPIREAGGFLGDWIKFKRGNWKTTVEISRGILDVRGVKKIDPIQAKYGVDIMQKASLEDDRVLQEMWAGLIANSLDPEVNVSPRKVLISLLGELESIDAYFLKEASKLNVIDFRLSEVLCLIERPLSDLLLTIDNLCRLELLRNNAMYGFGGADGVTEDSPFSLTALSATLLTSVQLEVVR
ncbi:MAG: DUF4393 domain-containing protein [Mariprofundus sp.]|nr:DUF4393 domain-containing protein [Mariprofundus sp.]